MIWQQVIEITQLADGDVVRIKGSGLETRYKVSVEELRGGGEGVRFKDIDDWSVNIHYHVGARSLVEAGVIERQLFAQVCEFDVWATEWKAWGYRPNDPGSARTGPWLQIAPNTLVGAQEIDEDAVLVWRRGNGQPDPVEE